MALSSWFAVDVDQPQPAAEHGLQLDGGAEGAAQQVGHAGDQLVGVDRRRRQRLLAREGEQAPGEVGGAGGAVARHGEVFLVVLLALGEAALHHVERAHHHRQHVVEVVRDAAAEMPDRLHLLQLADLLLGVLAARHLGDQGAVGVLQLLGARDHLALQDLLGALLAVDVDDRGDRADDLAVEVADRRRDLADPVARAVGGLGDALDLRHLGLALEHAIDRQLGLAHRGAVGVDQLPLEERAGAPAGGAEEALELPVAVDDLAVRPGDHHRDRHGVEDGAQLQFVAPELVVDPVARLGLAHQRRRQVVDLAHRRMQVERLHRLRGRDAAAGQQAQADAKRPATARTPGKSRSPGSGRRTRGSRPAGRATAPRSPPPAC